MGRVVQPRMLAHSCCASPHVGAELFFIEYIYLILFLYTICSSPHSFGRVGFSPTKLIRVGIASLNPHSLFCVVLFHFDLS